MARAVNWNNVSMLTPGMKNLGNQFNRRFKNRDGRSDGAIGDYAHQQGRSGHNPDDTRHNNAEWDNDSDNTPEVRAIDVDSTLNEPGVSMQDVINHMRRLPGLSSVIRYMIYNRKIYSASNGFRPQSYSGSNPHTEHAHFSGAYSQASDRNSSFDFQFDKLGDVDMPLTNDDADVILNRDNVPNPYSDAETNPRITVATALKAAALSEIATRQLPEKLNALTELVTLVAEKVDIDDAEIERIKTALAVPTSQENADAVVASLGGVDTETLAATLRSVLGEEKTAALKAAL